MQEKTAEEGVDETWLKGPRDCSNRNGTTPPFVPTVRLTVRDEGALSIVPPTQGQARTGGGPRPAYPLPCPRIVAPNRAGREDRGLAPQSRFSLALHNPRNAQKACLVGFCSLLACLRLTSARLLTGTGGEKHRSSDRRASPMPSCRTIMRPRLQLRTGIPIGRRIGTWRSAEESGGLDCQVAKVGRCRPSGTSPIRKLRSGTVEIHGCGMEALTTRRKGCPVQVLLTV